MMLQAVHVPWVWPDSSCQAMASSNHRESDLKHADWQAFWQGELGKPMLEILFVLLVARQWRLIRFRDCGSYRGRRFLQGKFNSIP